MLWFYFNKYTAKNSLHKSVSCNFRIPAVFYNKSKGISLDRAVQVHALYLSFSADVFKSIQPVTHVLHASIHALWQLQLHRYGNAAWLTVIPPLFFGKQPVLGLFFLDSKPSPFGLNIISVRRAWLGAASLLYQHEQNHPQHQSMHGSPQNSDSGMVIPAIHQRDRVFRVRVQLPVLPDR